MSELGIVDSVAVNEDDGRVLVNVFLGAGRTADSVPFRTPMVGMWIVPEIDQVVEVYETGTGRKAARLPHSTPAYDMPSGLSEGDFALTTNQGTSIIVKNSGDVDIGASGDVNIDAQGNVVIDGIDFDAHTHDYDDSTDTSTTTKTTEAPN